VNRTRNGTVFCALINLYSITTVSEPKSGEEKFIIFVLSFAKKYGGSWV